MVQNPPCGSQRIVPYLLYADAPAAIEFLTRAFGFTERMRMPGPEGLVMHCELDMCGEIVMIASAMDSVGTKGPRDLPAFHAFALVYVDDVDAHHARAEAEGAEILTPPEDQFYGDRTYRARDCEGLMWTFAQHVRDVDPADFPRMD
ncbi:MAG: VOC family protein [Planctomycetota bacterium]|nr:VOC family protein [Planctomycetota bacterium]